MGATLHLFGKTDPAKNVWWPEQTRVPTLPKRGSSKSTVAGITQHEYFVTHESDRSLALSGTITRALCQALDALYRDQTETELGYCDGEHLYDVVLSEYTWVPSGPRYGVYSMRLLVVRLVQ